MGFLELKICFFKRGCLGGGGISCFFGMSVCVALIFERAEGGASKPGPPLAAPTAAVCTEQHQMKVASCSQSYLTQLIEYGEGLQHTPELERRHQKICMACCRFLHDVRSLYHTSNSINTQNKSRYHTSNNHTTATTAKGLVRLNCSGRLLLLLSLWRRTYHVQQVLL